MKFLIAFVFGCIFADLYAATPCNGAKEIGLTCLISRPKGSLVNSEKEFVAAYQLSSSDDSGIVTSSSNLISYEYYDFSVGLQGKLYLNKHFGIGAMISYDDLMQIISGSKTGDKLKGFTFSISPGFTLSRREQISILPSAELGYRYATHRFLSALSSEKINGAAESAVVKSNSYKENISGLLICPKIGIRLYFTKTSKLFFEMSTGYNCVIFPSIRKTVFSNGTGNIQELQIQSKFGYIFAK